MRPVGDASIYPETAELLAAFARVRPSLVAGEPSRVFTCKFTVTVSADDVAAVTTADVAEYLGRALVLSIDYEAEGDSRLARGIAECRLEADGL